MIAELVLDTGVSANALLDGPPEVLEALIDIRNERAKQANSQALLQRLRVGG